MKTLKEQIKTHDRIVMLGHGTRFIFKIMIWNIFKNIFLGLFGIAVIAMGLTIITF
jgi:hypothetical protein